MENETKIALIFYVTFERHGVIQHGLCEGTTSRGFYVTRAMNGLLYFVAPQELRYA